MAFVKRAEGADVAFGDGDQQRFVAPETLHTSTVACQGPKGFNLAQKLSRPGDGPWSSLLTQRRVLVGKRAPRRQSKLRQRRPSNPENAVLRGPVLAGDF